MDSLRVDQIAVLPMRRLGCREGDLLLWQSRIHLTVSLGAGLFPDLPQKRIPFLLEVGRCYLLVRFDQLVVVVGPEVWYFE
jgi:hypothetical protein